jgi:hypothetical protein
MMIESVNRRGSRASHAVRVWDCFLINDELELLRFRLEHLADVVDVVVLVEAPWTYTGRAKPLYASQLLDGLGADRDRIRHVVVDETLGDRASASDRERAQHRGIRSGLEEVGPDDLVIVGDVDEIPSPATISCLRSQLRQPVRLIMDHAVLAANLKMPVPWNDGPKACRGSQLDHPEMALLLGHPDAAWSPLNRHIVADAGWHLSYLGGKQTVRHKLASFAHTEFDTPFNRSDVHLDRCLRYGVDLRGRHLLERLEPQELPPMLADLRRSWPTVFDFRPNPPITARILYRAYARVRQSQRLPAGFAASADRSLWLLLPLAPVLIPFDLLASFAARARQLWRRRRGSLIPGCLPRKDS